MKQHRFFVNPNRIKANTAIIAGPPVWHITKVLRLTKGHHLTIFDGQNHEYEVEIAEAGKREIKVVVLEKRDICRESPLNIILVQALPRAGKFDMVLQKGTELGVKRFVPLLTERTVTRTPANKLASKMERWRQIVIEACAQSGRTELPELSPPMEYDKYLENSNENEHLKLVLHPDSEKTFQNIKSDCEKAESVIILAGAEGGLSDIEIETAENKDWQLVSLGPRVLRTETISISAITLCQYLWGDI